MSMIVNRNAPQCYIFRFIACIVLHDFRTKHLFAPINIKRALLRMRSEVPAGLRVTKLECDNKL